MFGGDFDRLTRSFVSSELGQVQVHLLQLAARIQPRKTGTSLDFSRALNDLTAILNPLVR